MVEVLTGADTEGVRKWQHEQVSTYGIGTEHTRPEWKAIGRELIRLGYVGQDPAKFNVLSLTTQGVDALKQRTTHTAHPGGASAPAPRGAPGRRDRV